MVSMDMSPVPSNTGKRARSRLRVHSPGRFMSTAENGGCVLLDLSCTGAQIFLGMPIKVGADLLVEWNGRELFGSVAWYADGKCGVLFDEPLAEAVVLAARDLPTSDDAALSDAAREWVQGRLRSGTED